ncbi:MBL fold metallo-hydrolase [Paenibacillus aquistagni]|uniref:MBL fold metallo-hydrolase n=1 Tax=Paenibacillus aquistagni TaxID=1852522 RepID=UPI00145B61B0|nr:MBL fold metallo-hydrolase [Paenibacillus aquistagni]NMM53683.1 MBL fold metallo-hydrolase [Paenibacillus aquistagni]
MKLQLVRHATLWMAYGEHQWLIDPMFSDQGANTPIIHSSNDKRNPLVPLPFSAHNILHPDTILLTHLHQDHWDEAAQSALDQSLPILCQPGDEPSIRDNGFRHVTTIEDHYSCNGVTLSRTSGQHGTGEVGEWMGSVSGFVFQADNEPTVYVAGDSIWCEDVRQALDAYQPNIIIVNAGGAQFVMGDPITMNADDIVQVCRYAPQSKVIAVHMDTINHCHETRTILRQKLNQEGLLDQVTIPEDGEWLVIGT